MRSSVVLLLLAAAACSHAVPEGAAPPTVGAAVTATAADPKLADPLVGTTPGAWTTEGWLNSPPLTLASLRGRVVLIRWFAGTSCPMCSASAPALSALSHDYGNQGLTVIGMYHHKEDAALRAGEYEGYVKQLGFAFPVARDPDWRTLKSWWLDGHERSFTSVSFLLDREGRVRGIHQGGRLAKDEPDYDAMKRGIEKLLAEPPRGS